MFERFTQDARLVVVEAQEEATRLHHGRIGTEHLLLALLRRDTPTTAVLAAARAHARGRHGVRRRLRRPAATSTPRRSRRWASTSTPSGRRWRPRSGPGALDVDARGRGSGPGGHIPFTPRAKKVLELSLREALALKQKAISDGHIALGLLREGEGLAAKVLHDLGVDLVDLRRDITAALLDGA